MHLVGATLIPMKQRVCSSADPLLRAAHMWYVRHDNVFIIIVPHNPVSFVGDVRRNVCLDSITSPTFTISTLLFFLPVDSIPSGVVSIRPESLEDLP